MELLVLMGMLDPAITEATEQTDLIPIRAEAELVAEAVQAVQVPEDRFLFRLHRLLLGP